MTPSGVHGHDQNKMPENGKAVVWVSPHRHTQQVHTRGHAQRQSQCAQTAFMQLLRYRCLAGILRRRTTAQGGHVGGQGGRVGRAGTCTYSFATGGSLPGRALPLTAATLLEPATTSPAYPSKSAPAPSLYQVLLNLEDILRKLEENRSLRSSQCERNSCGASRFPAVPCAAAVIPARCCCQQRGWPGHSCREAVTTHVE